MCNSSAELYAAHLCHGLNKFISDTELEVTVASVSQSDRGKRIVFALQEIGEPAEPPLLEDYTPSYSVTDSESEFWFGTHQEVYAVIETDADTDTLVNVAYDEHTGELVSCLIEP